MVRFQCVSSLENGLDIKRAGEFVKEAIHSGGKVTVRNGARKGDAKLIFNVMSLNIKKGVLKREIFLSFRLKEKMRERMRYLWKNT